MVGADIPFGVAQDKLFDSLCSLKMTRGGLPLGGMGGCATWWQARRGMINKRWTSWGIGVMKKPYRNVVRFGKMK